MKKNLVVGITGQSGAGKTLVANIIESYGFNMIYADIVSRKVVEPNQPALFEIAEHFGEEVLHLDGTLNRASLAKLVFNDKAKKEELEGIIFPHIISEIKFEIIELQRDGSICVFIDAPTLFESGADNICDIIISVLAPRETRFNRILDRDKISLEHAEARLNSQHKDDYYSSRSDFIIENSGEKYKLEPKVLEIVTKLGLQSYIKRV